jgi:hypothetical protein
MILNNLLMYLSVTIIFVSCHDNATNPSNNIDVGTAKDYFMLRTGNWWSYTVSPLPSNQIIYNFPSYTIHKTIQDSSRHQNGNLLFQFSNNYRGRISYTILNWYAVTDSGIFIYDGIQDSVYINNQWITTNTRKIPILLNPIIIGHSWTIISSDSLEFYQIVSIIQQTVGGIIRPVVCIAHSTPTRIDTTWYAKDYGLICIHDYTTSITPFQGSRTVLDSCYIQ